MINTASRMARRSSARWVLGLAVAIAALTGCEKQDDATSSSSASTSLPTVGVTLLTVQHQFYQDLRAGLEEEAARHGYRLLISSAEFDPSRQANQIDEFLVQKVRGLIVSPCDSRSVGASIAAANDANVPVVTADIASTSTLGNVAVHVASDNVQGGRKAAELVVEALGEKGPAGRVRKVAILSHPVVTSVSDRVAGFKEEMAKHRAIEIVAELSADGKRDKAARVMEDLLQSHPDLDGVFAINDDTALGALATIEAAGKLGRVQIVGYDATPEARQKIRSGAIYGDVIQHPHEIGVRAVRALVNVIEGKRTPALIPIDVGTFTAKSDSAP